MLDHFLLSVMLSATGQAPSAVTEQFDRWERRLRARVERLHVVPAEAQNTPPCDVVVRFGVAKDGSPRGAVIREFSCGSYYRRRALQLVSELGRIGAVPSSAGKDHHVALKLSYGAQPDASADRRLTDALDAERAAAGRRNQAIVVMASALPAATASQSSDR